MVNDKIIENNSRLLIKSSAQSGVTPFLTTGTTNFIEGRYEWQPNEIMGRELFVNRLDERLWVGMLTGTCELVLANNINNYLTGSTPDLSVFVHKTGDTMTGTLYSPSISATSIYSGSTDLYDIFLTTADGNDITRVQHGLNTYTGGTGNNPTVNISAATLSSLIVSGNTTLQNVFGNIANYSTISATTITTSQLTNNQVAYYNNGLIGNNNLSFTSNDRLNIGNPTGNIGALNIKAINLTTNYDVASAIFNSDLTANLYTVFATANKHVHIVSNSSDIFISGANALKNTFFGYDPNNLTPNKVGIRTGAVTSGYEVDVVGSTLFNNTLTASATTTAILVPNQNTGIYFRSIGSQDYLRVTNDAQYRMTLGGNSTIYYDIGGTRRFAMFSGYFAGASTDTYDLGTSATYWRNIYINNIFISNLSPGREVSMGRASAGNTAGYLLLRAGGADSTTANRDGGELRLSSGISNGSGSSYVSIYTATAGSIGTTDNTPTEKVRITGAGNVGIGTTAPTQKLDVNGTINATGYSISGTTGASGTFTTADAKTVTVTNGIITSII